MKVLISLLFLLKLVIIGSRKLLGIINLFRHGARTPLTIDSNGYDLLNLKWNQESGDLTNVGIRQLYLSGTRIRDIYIKENKLFSEDFKKEEFMMMSTDVNRTILSAYSQLQGIFPGNNNSRIEINESRSIVNLPQIVPVQVMAYPSIIFQIDDKNVCKGFNDEFFADNDNKELFKIETIIKINHYVDLFEKTIFPKLESKLRLSKSDLKERNNDNPRFIYHISDALVCALREKIDISFLGLSPANITFFLDYKDFFLLYGKRTDNVLKIMVIPFFDKIIELTEGFLSNTNNLKYVGYSYHDKNLVTLFRVLKMMLNNLEDVVIPFASELIIEVFDDGLMNFVYNNRPWFEITIQDFKLKRNNFLMSTTEFNNFCGFSNRDDKNDYSNEPKIIVILIITNVFLFSILIILFKKKMRNNTNDVDSQLKEMMLVDKKLNYKV